MDRIIENALPPIAAASPDDRQLMRAYVRGEPEAIRVVDTWIDSVLKSEFTSLQNDWDDLKQEIRLRVLANLRGGRFHGNSELRTYVHRISKNTAIDHWRRSSGRRGATARAGHRAADPVDPTRASDGLMSREILHKLILGLSPEERRLLAMVHIECLSYLEVARKLGVAVGTIKARVFRCRERLVQLRRELLEHPDS